MGKELFKTTQFIEAIKGSGGIITTIAERVGCTWHTAAKYIANYPTIKNAYEDECESISDIAQGKLIDALRSRKPDISIPAAKWWLERKRKREFALRTELDLNPDDKPIVVQVVRGVKHNDL
jgi:hypothetical protein